MRRRSAARRRLPSSRTTKNKRSCSSMIEMVMHISHHCNHEPALFTRIETTYRGNVDNEQQKQNRKHMSNKHGQKLAGKTAVITGGATGIGLAAAQRFIEEGAFVFIFGRRQNVLDAAVADLGPNARAVKGSVSDEADLDRLYAAVKAARGTLDIVFANAGV